MTVHALSERQIIQEAAQMLIQHMSPARAARFWAAWQVGEGDYLAIRKQLFHKETVASLYKQIEDYQEEQEK
ncbi:MAG: hypothetical protein Q7U34_04915 [Anaerolineales bacterium]|nr:hypothetical protein [Anaerolineales bacterium]